MEKEKEKFNDLELLFSENRFEEALSLCLKERFEDVKKFLQRTVEKQPQNLMFHLIAGKYYLILKKYDEALKSFSTVLSLKNDFFPALMGCAIVMQSVGEFSKAKAFYLKAIKIDAQNERLLWGLGQVSYKLDEMETANVYLSQALAINPKSVDTLVSLAQLHKKLGNLQDAMVYISKALELRPNNFMILVFVADLYFSRGRRKEGVTYLKKAMNAYSPSPDPYNSHLMLFNYQDSIPPSDVIQAHIDWGKAKNSANYVAAQHSKEKNKKLRIGYVSPDFHQHSVATFFEPIIENHNKSEYEIYCYSDASIEDEITENIKQMSDGWRKVLGKNNDELITLVTQDKIDILVDLTGYTKGNRMAFFTNRVAPVQVSYLGYPASTGLTSMDYYVTDELCDPIGESDQYYVEKLVRIPNSFFTYKPPGELSDVSELPAIKNGYITFASFNELKKIDVEVIKLWCGVLSKFPDSKFYMQCSAFLDLNTKQWIESIFESFGIMSERLVLVPRADFNAYLQCHNEVDIILDAFPWNGHTITCHALAMGVPVVTLVGKNHVSRMGYSTLKNLDYQECIAFTKEEYIEKACRLAGDISSLANMRKNMRSRLLNSHLCDGKQFTELLEKEYRKMWNTWCDNGSSKIGL